MENTDDNVDDFDDGNTLRRINEDNDKNNYKYNEYEIEEEFEINSDYNNDDINNDITLKTENFNSGKKDANKIESKVLYENENHTQLIELEGGNLEDSQGKLEGSTLKRMKNTYISSSTGMLYMVNENENITIKQLNKESLKSLTEQEEIIKNEIHNDNNQIGINLNDFFIGQNITFNISNIKSNNIHNVVLTDNITNREIINNIYNFFNKYTCTKYSQVNDNTKNLRVLKNFKSDLVQKDKDSNSSDIKIEYNLLFKNNNNNKILRNLQSYNPYYGIINFENEKIIFKYNLIGLILEGIVVSKIDVSTGVVDNYLNLIFGYENTQIKFESLKTNFHIIIQNSNQMTYNFLGLLYDSNENLKKRNIEYSNIIIDLEKKISDLLYGKYYDYSNDFRFALDDLYIKVKNLTGVLFNELIDVIEKVYDKYIKILNATEYDEYTILNDIRNITKSEYLNHINNTFNYILDFKNNTFSFLNNLSENSNIISNFDDYDVLFDIIDIIHDGKIIYKEFIIKLFKAVDRAITIFKYDLRDHFEDIAGEILNLTDFLSININKNEIIRNAINSTRRQEITWKLKNFRNIIFRIEEILSDNIMYDYNKTISLDDYNIYIIYK